MQYWPLRIALAALLLAGGAVPSSAETLEELDALSDAATSEAGGIAAARDFAGRGEYLDALAMLERTLAAFPRSTEGLLLHAQYLCAIDDRQGGLLELQLLRDRDYADGVVNGARATCEAGSDATPHPRDAAPAPLPTRREGN